jgi:hypothetical protein
VKYLIDGRGAWTEHEAAYYYGGNDGNYGNWLITSFLKPGIHTFTVRATSTSGDTATDTVTARVVTAPPAPKGLAGTWTHRVTGSCGYCKNHRARFVISSVGWATGPGDRFDARYLSKGRVIRVVFGPEVVTPTQQTGAFCGVDPLHKWTLRFGPRKRSFDLRPVGHDPCPDRLRGLKGKWTRVR